MTGRRWTRAPLMVFVSPYLESSPFVPTMKPLSQTTLTRTVHRLFYKASMGFHLLTKTLLPPQGLIRGDWIIT